MATIELTGPIRIDREAGPWSDTEERRMTHTLRAAEHDVDPAFFVHMGFTQPPKRIVEAITGKRMQDTTLCSRGYRPVKSNVEADAHWDVQVVVLSAEDLYGYACGVAASEEYASDLQSPFAVLKRWAMYGSQVSKQNGGTDPVEVLAFLAEYVADKNECSDDLADAPAWDSLIETQRR